MKKQLHKLKTAAENFSVRPSKSDKSSEDLQKADKQVDRFKDVLEKVAKKFSPNPVATVQAQQTPEQDQAARDKRIKKVHEHRLALAIEDCLKDMPESLLRDVLDNCAQLERKIASEVIRNEINVENDVTRQLSLVQETQLSTIQKQKRIVTKLQQDSDSARHKYQSAVRLNDPLTKIKQLREELEDCEGKLEKERDIWAAEMFELIAEEETIAGNILDYVKLQQFYYKTVLSEVENVMEQMSNVLRLNKRRLFKVPLLDHLEMSNRKISYVIELCVCALYQKGMTEEGLLRVGCAGSKLRRMKSAIDANIITPPLPQEYQDVNVIACVLKSYLRDLPDPLLTNDLYGEFVAAALRPTEAQRKTAILNAINKLPEGHYFNLRYLTRFLHLLAGHADKNKMNSQNIAIVMSPNLLWAPNHEDVDYAQKVSSTTSVNTIVETLVADWDFFFDGDVDFYVTLSRDDLFPDNGGFPLDRDSSTATIGGDRGDVGVMFKSATTNGQSGSGGGGGGSSQGVSYMQPMGNNNSLMSQSFMGPSSLSNANSGGAAGGGMGPSSMDSLRHSHSRSSSHDTSLILLNDSGGGSAAMKHSQSNSSLSDQSSPPLMDSPKLPVRKKHNKSMAPTPPSQASGSGGSSTSKSHSRDKQTKEAVKANLQDRLSGGHEKPEKPPRPAGMSTECQTLNRLAYKTAKSSMMGGGGGGAGNNGTAGPGRPIALPRTTVMRAEASLHSSREGLKSSEDEEEAAAHVTLREERAAAAAAEKPAIPERPASLMRSNFFKGSLQEVNTSPSGGGSGEGNGHGGLGSTSSLSGVKKAQSFRATGEAGQQRGKDAHHNNGGMSASKAQTMLERAQFFSVDKQQVSIIDVPPTLKVAPIAVAESNAITTPTADHQPPLPGNSGGGGEGFAVPPSPRSLMAGADTKGMVIKRPQVPAPPPPTNRKSQDSLGGGAGGSDTEVTGL